jgi:hypothetical protein
MLHTLISDKWVVNLCLVEDPFHSLSVNGKSQMDYSHGIEVGIYGEKLMPICLSSSVT